jgi:hypothetical protein
VAHDRSAEPERYVIPTLVEIYGKTLNLLYMILAEEKTPAKPSALDLTMAHGRLLHLQGDDAEQVRRRIRELLPESSGPHPPVRATRTKVLRRPNKGEVEGH